MTNDRRTQILNAVALYANGCRPDVVVNRFTQAGIDVLGNSEHLRAVAQLATAYRLGESPSEKALELLGIGTVAA